MAADATSATELRSRTSFPPPLANNFLSLSHFPSRYFSPTAFAKLLKEHGVTPISLLKGCEHCQGTLFAKLPEPTIRNLAGGTGDWWGGQAAARVSVSANHSFVVKRDRGYTRSSESPTLR